MRILQLHSDFIEYEPVEKEIQQAEPAEKKKYRVEDVLVLFTSVEKEDDGSVGRNAIDEVKKVLENLKSNRILIYPFAHLSGSLAKPTEALKVLKEMEKRAEELNIETYRAPFGWNKKLSIAVKGHPLAEQSKVIVGENIGTKKPREHADVEKDKFHRFMVMDVEGKEYEISKSTWKDCKVFDKSEKVYKLLKSFVRNELEGNPPKEDKPKHIEFMRKLELVDYCPESDVGHMKFYPNGILIKDLILDYAWKNVASPWGAMKMQNPLVYRTDVEEIKKLQGEFHERDYLIEGGNFVLRFASDPGAFPFVQKVNFSYKNMPLKVYEEAICFRKEQKGEVSGLMRVRNFTMTDQHAFCQNEEQAKEEYERLCCLFAKLMNEIIAGGYWVLGFEIVEEFYDKYKDFFGKIIKKIKVPAFFKLMKEMSHYYAFKNEYQAIFPDGNNLQISTVQWDIKNGDRFNICYVDADGKRTPVPFIIHASSFGSIERAIAAMLEKAAWEEKEGNAPTLPVWISPTQVRLIPVSDKYVDDCERLSEEIERNNIRVDIDDREDTVQKKVRYAELDWTPFILVVGPKEIENKELSVRFRKTGKLENLKMDKFLSMIKEETAGMPFKKLILPKLLSKRPIFVG